MGHYDDCYEADHSIQQLRDIESAKIPLKSCIEGLRDIRRNLSPLSCIPTYEGHYGRLVQIIQEASLLLDYYILQIEKRSKE